MKLYAHACEEIAVTLAVILVLAVGTVRLVSKANNAFPSVASSLR